MRSIQFMTSLLTFYLKGEISQDQNFIKMKKPNTILALIPLGAKKESVPVSQLASVDSNFKLHLKSLLVGLILVIAGFACMGSSFLAGLLLLLIGANKGITAFETVLSIKTTAGEAKELSFLIFDKAKAEQAEAWIEEAISNRMDDTNNRVQTDRILDSNRDQTDRLIEALKNK